MFEREAVNFVLWDRQRFSMTKTITFNLFMRYFETAVKLRKI